MRVVNHCDSVHRILLPMGASAMFLAPVETRYVLHKGGPQIEVFHRYVKNHRIAPSLHQVVDRVQILTGNWVDRSRRHGLRLNPFQTMGTRNSTVLGPGKLVLTVLTQACCLHYSVQQYLSMQAVCVVFPAVLCISALNTAPDQESTI